MEMSDVLREAVILGDSGNELRKKAIEEGMITTGQSGLIKIREQLTSVEEVLREKAG